MKKQTYYLIVIFLFNLWGIQAQEAILSTDGNATGSGGTSSYSVGLIFYTTIIGSNGSMAQGLQQPFEISGVLGVDDLSGINLNLLAYPNPTTDFLYLTVTQVDYKNLSYQLFDINGRLLAHKKLENNSSKITMKQFPSAMYFLKIFDNQKLVRLFKIIKN
jgi:Secretion system C-terminal sorting domain